MTRIAAIDIGTNTILMLIADAEQGTIRSIVRDEHAIARLGKGVDANRVILPETFRRTEDYLRTYINLAISFKCDYIRSCGTSALRDAANRDDFVAHIRSALGIDIEILTKEEEALMTYRGGISGLSSLDEEKKYAVIDIGGGSTEIALGAGSRVLDHCSLDIGSVRLTERFLQHSPPLANALEEARAFVRTALDAVPPVPAETEFIGVAGTLTTLAALDLQLQHYQRDRVDGHRLNYSTVSQSFEYLRGLTLRQLKAIPQILPERADILVAGILILREILDHYKQQTILVSDRGLRYGILLREAARLAAS